MSRFRVRVVDVSPVVATLSVRDAIWRRRHVVFYRDAAP
jgi:hypothetical protein